MTKYVRSMTIDYQRQSISVVGADNEGGQEKVVRRTAKFHALPYLPDVMAIGQAMLFVEVRTEIEEPLT